MRANKPTLSLLTVTILFAVACGGSQVPEIIPGAKQVRGQIIEVVARDIAEVETLSIRNDSGQEYSFTTEGFVGFTPSHIKEHQLFGQTLLVFYLERGDQLVAVKVDD